MLKIPMVPSGMATAALANAEGMTQRKSPGLAGLQLGFAIIKRYSCEKSLQSRRLTSVVFPLAPYELLADDSLSNFFHRLPQPAALPPQAKISLLFGDL